MEQAQTSTTRPKSQKLMTPAEVAELLGVREDTLTVWRCQKRYPLPYVKIGRAVRYRAADVAAFIELRTVAGE